MAAKLRAGKGYELTVVGMLVGSRFDIYLPTVDDQGIDAIIRLPVDTTSCKYHEVQIKGAKTWNGIRCDTSSLTLSSVLILYCAAERKVLWLLHDDVQRHFPRDGAIHRPTWGNVLINAAKVRELTCAGHDDLAKLKAMLSAGR